MLELSREASGAGDAFDGGYVAAVDRRGERGECGDGGAQAGGLVRDAAGAIPAWD